MVLVDKAKGFVAIAYLDYSQIELRFTVQYTIAVGNPDLNLSRAYMPYKCYKEVGHGDPLDMSYTYFDFNNREHIKHAYSWKWVHEEDHTPWHELDVHAATTKIAYPHIDPTSDEFKKLRGKIGKPVNFAKNFGAQFNRIKQMFPDMTDEEVKIIDEAYYKAFPGVKTYHDYCRYRAQTTTSTVNLYGFRYYGLNGHKLTNALIQGSAAFYLKKKIREVAKFLEEGKYKSRLQMTIHDEVSLELYNGEEFILEKIKAIMEEAPELQVPIVAELEITTTNWAEKTDKFNSIREAIYG
jgi:DNA polymerase-1